VTAFRLSGFRDEPSTEPKSRTPLSRHGYDHGVSRPRTLAYPYALAPALVAVAIGPVIALVGPPSATVAVPAPLVAVGVLAVVAGLAVAVWGVHSFAVGGTVPSPVGEPERLVTDGALAYSRNPIYLGTVVAAAGEALAFGAPALAGYAAALWLVYHLLVVYREEPALADAFGRDYEDYREAVSRWL